MTTSPPVREPGACPVCRRYTGPVPICPYCDVSIPLPPALKLIKAAAVLLAVAGLLMLWLAAARLQPADVRVVDLSPAMNHARIRVNGLVTGSPRSGREPGSLSFTINDDGHRLRIFASAAAAPSRSPGAGDNVTVTGNLKFTAGRDPVLFVRSAAHIVVPATGSEGPAP